ncbi:YidB family protein [Dryocola sp. BD586]|uniref:YidB family protein n=1 Tax=Dryocola sp. BD586 TaxID=3133271 RepID=UPI003F506ED5
MGLFDQVTGMMKGGDAGKFKVILSWINEQGGIQAILDQFRQKGFGEVVTSWLSGAHNQSVNPEQVLQVLGTPAISSLAEKLGVDVASAAIELSEQFPKIVDALSPEGEVKHDDEDLLTRGYHMLRDKFFS